MLADKCAMPCNDNICERGCLSILMFDDDMPVGLPFEGEHSCTRGDQKSDSRGKQSVRVCQVFGLSRG